MTRIERPGVRRGYDLWASQYDSTENPLVEVDRQHAIAALAPLAGERILDAGCGTGAHLRTLAAHGVTTTGIDFSAAMLRQAARGLAQSRARAQTSAVAVPRLVLGDLQAPLPFGNAAFDAVLCSLVSEHLSDPAVFFGEAYRVVAPGGRLVFSAFHPDLAQAGVEANFERDGIEYRLGAETHTEADFRAAMKTAGWRDISSRTIRGDAELARRSPRASKYVDKALLLLLQAQRP